MPSLTAALRTEYQSLFDECQVRPERASLVDATVTALIANLQRYQDVGRGANAPWQFVAVIHNMECSQRFDQHLHNGDPLTARTRRQPPGRPATGAPPFTWEVSAIDALSRLDGWQDWSIPGVLYMLERYNGWGYRAKHPEVKSPYLWSFSNQYTRGKFVADGTWSDTAVSKQCGAATLLRRFAERGEFDAAAPRFANLRYAPRTVSPGGAELQHFLNGHPGIYLREDGKLGPRTSVAYRKVFGAYLRGDPRGR